jgi:hypothetical protein
VPFRRICDHAGALRHHDRIRLARDLEKYERRILPAALAVYFPNITEPFSLMRHTFWMFNHMDIQVAGFGERGEKLGVDPQWLLVLVIDVRTATACFIWGYQLDPYIHIERINASIVKSRLLLRDGLLMAGIRKVMKDAVRHVVSQAGPVLRHPGKYNVVFKKEEMPFIEGKETKISFRNEGKIPDKEAGKRKWEL